MSRAMKNLVVWVSEGPLYSNNPFPKKIIKKIHEYAFVSIVDEVISAFVPNDSFQTWLFWIHVSFRGCIIGKMVGPPWDGGPLIINPIHLISRGYLLGPKPLLKGLLGGYIQ